MKGIFIPEITVEMFRDGCLESIEALMAEGEVYDIEYDLKPEEQDVPDRNVGKWIPCCERLPETEVLCCDKYGEMIIAYVYADDASDTGFSAESETQCMYGCVAWQPLPKPWKGEQG